MIAGLSTEVVVTRTGSNISLVIRNRDNPKFKQAACMSPETVEMLIRDLRKAKSEARRCRARRRVNDNEGKTR